MADEEIVVEVEKEPPAPPIPGTEAHTEQPDPVADLKAQYETLEAEKAAEANRAAAQAQRAQAAEQRAEQAQREVDSVRGEITETRLSTVEQGLSAAQVASDASEAAYVSAMEAGDWKKAAEAQRNLADARSDLKRLTEAKSDLEAAKAAPPQPRETRTEAPTAPADPVEAFLSRCEPGTAAWLRAHPDEARVLATNSDPRRVAKLRAADNDACAEGFAPGSKEYFAHVETFLGMNKTAAKPNGSNGTQAPAPKRPAAPPAAPVSASANIVNGGENNVVRLSPGEAKAATDGTHTWNYDDPSPQKKFRKGEPIGIQEMARRKKIMTEQGLYDKIYVSQ